MSLRVVSVTVSILSLRFYSIPVVVEGLEVYRIFCQYLLCLAFVMYLNEIGGTGSLGVLGSA